ncbi:MAG TPA: hypothetical protein VKD23_07825 [Terriglobales bacterium]|nr:hypothetical protein [Terriglobales bacterium]
MRGIPAADDLESLQCIHLRIQGAGAHPAIQGHSQAGSFQFALYKGIVDDHLRRDVGQFTPLPRLHLLSRWLEIPDGAIRRKHIVIGTQEDLPTESAAQAAVDAIRLEINQQTPQHLIKSISFETLVNHYRQHELPDIFNKTKPTPDAADEDRKSFSTQVTYEGYLKKWILPRWRVCRLKDIKATDVEKWLKSLCFPRTGVPLARGSRAKIRNIMSALYSHAIRWEWTEKNPITSVRQSAKRQRAPEF